MPGIQQAKGQDTSLSATGSTVITLPFTSNLTGGYTLLAIFRIGASAASANVTAVSDATDGSWTKVPNYPFTDSGGDSLHAWYLPNSASGVNPAVTITNSATSPSLRIGFLEVITSATSGVIDQSPTAINFSVGAGGVFTAPGATITAASETLICFEEQSNGGGTTTNNKTGANPATGWGTQLSIATNKLVITAVVSTTTGTYNDAYSCSLGDSGATGTITVFSSQQSPVSVTNHFLSLMGVGTTILFGMLSSLSNFFFGKADKQWA